MAIDLNSDVGEGFGSYRLGDDGLVLKAVTSANVACGFHAGDPRVMRITVGLAARLGVEVGAHPGYPDLVGFGRRDMSLSPDEVHDDLVYQIGALWAFARRQGVRLTHVKPHGALYNRAATDRPVADAIASAVRSLDMGLILVGLAGSELCAAGMRAGIPVAGEAFADRAYKPDGTLVPRSRQGAVISDQAQVVKRAVSIARDHVVETADGGKIPVVARTICLHGDTRQAAELAMAVRRGLSEAGVEVRPLSVVVGGGGE
ncbi:MAG: 5-oxoprolinase subunit PxpA [Firmicutes bacterium]|jgi:UPF0271 protein|nr:5-oxoprolinase subunit PxpA [Bacillota bacterium]